MSDKIGDIFVTTRRKPVTSVTIEGNKVTENLYRKSVTPVTTESNNVMENPYRKSVTPLTTDTNNITEHPYRKSVTPLTKDSSRDIAVPDWLRVGNTTLKDEGKSILYLPNAWLNDRIVDAAQEILKCQFPHIWSLDTCLKASNLTFKRARGNFIQIVNRDPLKGGSHWLTLSTMKLKSANEIKIVPYLAFLWEKVKTVDFSETIAACDLKVGRCRQLIEYMKVCEYWRSRSFLFHRFSRFCMFCALLGQDIRWAFTGPLVLWFMFAYLQNPKKSFW